MTRLRIGAAAIALSVSGAVYAQAADMTFFVTSAGSGKGADFGGLAGADKLCQTLAAAVGAGGKTWRAYLSTQGAGAVNAKDRIGNGPWQNVKGVVIAKNVAELHGDNNLNKQTGLTEKGDMVKDRDDPPNQHDILTGSQPDGTAFSGADDKTCGNWTKSGDDGSAIVGHVNRAGTSPPPGDKSWNSSHGSRGCSDPGLASTGGAGKLYCFATK